LILTVIAQHLIRLGFIWAYCEFCESVDGADLVILWFSRAVPLYDIEFNLSLDKDEGDVPFFVFAGMDGLVLAKLRGYGVIT